MNLLVSVVVPIYNVEVYLRDCLDSIICQTYHELEILLIEDGSTDGCPEICDEYAMRDSRILVIHQMNGGLSVARNAGMKIASGEFLCFVDSDDKISHDYVETLYKACIETDSDISMCAFCREEYELGGLGSEREFYSGYEMNRRLNQDDSGIYGVICNKLYRRVLFHGIDFPPGKIHEDEFITYRLYWNARKCAVLNDKLYYYRQRPDSIVNSSFSERSMDAAIAYQERICFYIGKGVEELAALAKACYCHFLRENFRRIIACNLNVEYWKKEMFAAYFSVINSKSIRWKKKASVSVQMLSPFLYKKMKDMLK